jgi:hypothetical protein
MSRCNHVRYLINIINRLSIFKELLLRARLAMEQILEAYYLHYIWLDENGEDYLNYIYSAE